MEAIDPVWQLGGIALVIGFLLGTVIQMRLKPKSGDIDKLKAEMEKTRAEMEQYKASVNRHFNKTSDLVNELTQDYVKVYQHLAEGAQSLSDTPVFAQMLEQSQGRVLISVEDDSVDTQAEVEAVADPLANVVVAPSIGSSESAAADAIEATDADTGNAAEAQKQSAEQQSIETADDDTARDDDRRDPVIADSPQQADAAAAIEAEADSASAADAVKKA